MGLAGPPNTFRSAPPSLAAAASRALRPPLVGGGSSTTPASRACALDVLRTAWRISSFSSSSSLGASMIRGGPLEEEEAMGGWCGGRGRVTLESEASSGGLRIEPVPRDSTFALEDEGGG